jgi:pilus assembly protein CpaC
MARPTPIRAAALAALVSLAVSWALAPSAAGATELTPGEPQTQTIVVAASDFGSRSVALGVGKSVVIDFPRDIKDVLVANPKTANAVIRSSRRAYVIGVEVGQTNVFFFDAEGRQMAGLDIAVTRNLNGIRAAIRQVLPDADIHVEGIGEGVILTGTVSNQAEAQQAFDIATRLVGAGSAAAVTAGDKVVNAIVVRGRDQVMLKVTVAEMDRQVIKQLGINVNGSVGTGTSVVNFNNANPFPVNGLLSTANPFGANGSTATPGNSPAGITSTFKSVTANLQAMEQAGVVRTLAEPTLTAISGESAHFLAGGSFPYPTVSGCTTTPCPLSIQFQSFGVGLSFTPVVLSEGRISLHVATEVSQLDPANSVTVEGTTVPGLSVRRADTTAEIPSGGTLAMAGMIQEQTKQTISGLPGLMEVPVLGTLFKSRDYLNDTTELVVLVTPYIVRAVAQKNLSRPDDGFADPSDPASVLLGRLNRIYGVGGTTDPPENYRGKYGFILD